MLWGAAVADRAFGSTAACGQRRRGEVAGAIVQGLSAGQDLSGKRQDQPSGRRRRHCARPSSAQTLRGPGNFAAEQVAMYVGRRSRGRFGALRAADVANNPSIWDIDVTQSGKVCVTSTLQAAAVASGQRSRGDDQDPLCRRPEPGADLGRGQRARPLARRAADQDRRAYQLEWPDTGDKSSLTFVDGVPAAAPISSAPRRC